jgi:predicted DNA-binding transcriptional regulator AlpA
VTPTNLVALSPIVDFVQLAAKPCYDIEDVAALTGTPPSTLYALWKEEKGPRSFKIGRRRVVTRQALNDWLSDLERTGGARLGDVG